MWHSDVNKTPQAEEVFQHLNSLHQEAIKRIKEDTWIVPGVLIAKPKLGKELHILYKKKHPFELGMMYIGENYLSFVIGPYNQDLVTNAISLISSFSYKDDKMKQEFSKYLPEIPEVIELKDGSLLVLMKKNNDLILLRDLFNHLDHKLDPKHVAWIMSSLYNLSCYLNFTGINNNAISLDTYFVCPEMHSGVLLGGWWYGFKVDKKLVALPSKYINCVPSHVLANRMSSSTIDLELIRALGRELLCGEPNKIHLLLNKDPIALTNWVCISSLGKPIDDYKKWQLVLNDAFGPRKFVPLDIKASDVYKSI